MFQKEGSFIITKGKKSKDNTPLKKSIRRKLRDDFLASIVTQEVNVDHIKEQVDFIFLDSKSEVSIRKLKRKDATSNAGATNVYSRTPNPSSSDDAHLNFWPYSRFSQVLMLEVDKILLPSLALLAVLPVDILNTLPTVVVPPIVSKYLCRGADCMRSGMLSLPDSHNGWVVIRVLDNAQPFAVGFVTKGTNPSTIGAETKGVGVRVVTCYGDEIYKSQFDKTAKPLTTGLISEIGGGIFDDGNYGNVGFIEGKRVFGLVKQGGGDEYNESEENDVDETSDIQKSVKNVDLSNSENQDRQIKIAIGDDINSEAEINADARLVSDEVESSSVDDPESILLQAFHDACVRISKSQLPMAASEFYSQHILPARKEGSFINLKETKWKKVGTFLMDQATLGVITVGTSNSDPVASLKSIDRSHADLRDARKRKKEQDKSASGGTTASAKNKLALANLYIIPKNIVTLMKLDEDDVKASNAKSEDRRGTGFLTAPECREILNRYILQNKLVDQFDPEMVTMDGPLTDALFRKSKKQLKTEATGKNRYDESVTRKDVNTRWLERMDKAYAIVSMPGSVITSMKRGEPPKVSFVVESRQSKRKFVTRVRGLEEYGVNPEHFANDVSKRFACSSSIEREAAGRETLKKGHVECIFQGNLVDELSALLLGDEKLSSHGGSKNSDYCLPKGVFEIDLRKGVPGGKKRK